jgi:transposase
LNLAEELDNVSKACRIMGVSRDTFYRYKDAVESDGVEALLEKSRRKPNPKNRIDAAVDQSIIDYAVEQPAHGQVRASNELRKRGIFVSPTGVRDAWLRHDLETFKKRLKALEAKAAAEGWLYTEAQIVALEMREQEREVSREIETHHPGYLGSQDVYYVGTLS